MVTPEVALRIVAAAASWLFAVLVLTSAPRRPAHQHFGAFFALLGANLGLEAWNGLTGDPATSLLLFRLATVTAALDPFFLYASLAMHPRRSSLARTGPMLLVLGGGAVFAASAIVIHPPTVGHLPSSLVLLAWATYTAVVYAVVLVHVYRETLRSEDPALRLLAPALALATIPAILRIASHAALAYNLGIGPAPLLGWLWLVWVPVGAVVVGGLRRWALRGPASARAARLVVTRATLAGIALALLLDLRSPQGLFAPDLPAAPFQLLGVAGGAIRWLLFGGMVSVALLRHELLGLSLRARRNAARAIVGVAFLLGAALLLQATRLVLGETAVAFSPTEIVLLGAVLVLSQGFRTAVDRVAARVYGVPAAGDLAAGLETYREAVGQALADGRAPEVDGALARLRREIGLDARTAAVVERMVASSPAAPLATGELVLGRYRLLQILGRGGGGRAFRARDELIHREVVLKEILDDGDGSAALREARIAGELRHPHVVAVHDVIHRPGAALLVTEFVPGETLAQRIARGPLEEPEAIALLRGILAGLAAAHARGIVHRDVKPANVLLDESGSPKIADFGIARKAGATAGLVAGDAFAGTPAFMAPEQTRGEPSTPASDVFAVGLLARQATRAPLSPGFAAVVDRALAERPEDRWHDAGAMLAALP